ncbi:hypothetical protein [Jiangella alkaliphila]|uniref:DUF1579 domain-containing protein n=1 Tax=Jiangella alkaliphila TaxID=419479 RepID=A0A1H2K0S6_9ACTN|nr:hypothetical protein [Jiangella alkaliphila]SDU62304.1 hypothetical protein SAMN04488563_3296 [Jiangella alkaliphila]
MSDADFDFLFGRWDVRNRWPPDLDDDTSWVEFPTTCQAGPILGGLGNVDAFSFAGLPGYAPWEAATVRLYDPVADLWRIFWTTSRRPGDFDSPMEGRFEDGVGVFYGSEERDGRAARVRFVWTHTPGTARWEQSYQFDEEAPWKTDWIMDFRPAATKG